MKQRPLFGAAVYARTFPCAGSHKIVLDANCLLRCPHCKELSSLQLRTMGDGTIRNQPRCGKCRGKKGKQ